MFSQASVCPRGRGCTHPTMQWVRVHPSHNAIAGASEGVNMGGGASGGEYG